MSRHHSKPDDAESRPRPEPTPNHPEGQETSSAETPEAQGVDDVLAEEELSELVALRTELEDAKDRALRCGAEMENYKKRVARQVEEERKFASLPLLRDLLPVFDNLGRAIDAAEKNASGAGLLEGVKMVLQQLRAVFTRYDCREIEALNEPFDPNRHEALSQQPTVAAAPGTVVQVVQPGFQLHERVVRPSQVIVSTALPETNPPTDA